MRGCLWDGPYNKADNRLTRDIDTTLVSGAPSDHDQAFVYDELHRLKNFDAGTLSGGSISSPAKQEDWTLDALGNWTNFVQKTGMTTDLDQDRTHNGANEVTHIEGSTTHVACDDAGNMTKAPKPSWSAHYDLKYLCPCQLTRIDFLGINHSVVRVAGVFVDGVRVPASLARRWLLCAPGYGSSC